MWIDLLALGLLGVFALVGALRGAVSSVAGVVALGLGYVAAIFGASWLGPTAAKWLGLPGLLGAPVAGTFAFLSVFGLCAAGSSILKAWDRERLGDLPRSSGDRFVGGLFGVLRGSLIVLMVGVLANWLDAGRQLSGGESFAAAPSTESSAVAGAAGFLVERAVEAAIDDPSGRFAARMAARPAATLENARTLMDDPRIQAVQRDRLFWSYVQNGAVPSALNRGSFWRVVNDDELRSQLGELGLIDEAATSDPAAFRAEAGRVLEAIGPRLKGLDQELEHLAKDPEIAALLEQGDTMGLLGHPEIQRVVSRVSAGL